MPRPTTAARRYAEAAFDLARGEEAVDGWADDLRLAATIVGEERIERVVDNPAIPLEERERAIDAAFEGKVREPVRRLVALLLRRGRGSLLPGVSREFDRLRNRERGIVTAVVTSAAPLSDEDLAAVRRRITAMRDATSVEIEQQVDPALIGGLMVRVGDRLIDATVRGRLERLRTQLVAGGRSSLDAPALDGR
jgi:F-type H+-transporting ATPase subunit delta